MNLFRIDRSFESVDIDIELGYLKMIEEGKEVAKVGAPDDPSIQAVFIVAIDGYRDSRKSSRREKIIPYTRWLVTDGHAFWAWLREGPDDRAIQNKTEYIIDYAEYPAITLQGDKDWIGKAIIEWANHIVYREITNDSL